MTTETTVSKGQEFFSPGQTEGNTGGNINWGAPRCCCCCWHNWDRQCAPLEAWIFIAGWLQQLGQRGAPKQGGAADKYHPRLIIRRKLARHPLRGKNGKCATTNIRHPRLFLVSVAVFFFFALWRLTVWSECRWVFMRAQCDMFIPSTVLKPENIGFGEPSWSRREK